MFSPLKDLFKFFFCRSRKRWIKCTHYFVFVWFFVHRFVCIDKFVLFQINFRINFLHSYNYFVQIKRLSELFCFVFRELTKSLINNYVKKTQTKCSKCKKEISQYLRSVFHLLVQNLFRQFHPTTKIHQPIHTW